MHYILNTQFRIPAGNQVARVGGPTIPGQPIFKQNSTAVIDSNFKKGVIYTLMNIKKLDEGVQYTFKSSEDNSIIDKLFSSCTEADEFIANIRGEVLPEYENFYKGNRN